MSFVDVCRASYDYAPQTDEELTVAEGDLLLVLEKDEDDWWKCKKKAATDDDDEPEGLVPANYVEKVQPISHARALYDYAQQTDEELSFQEEDLLDVYDDSDTDWTLVGAGGHYGFAPAIYIEVTGAPTATVASPPAPGPAPAPVPALVLQERAMAPLPIIPKQPPADEPLPGEADYPSRGQIPSTAHSAAAASPAANLAKVIAQKTGDMDVPATASRGLASPPLPARPPGSAETGESEDEVPPPKPQRPQSQLQSPQLPKRPSRQHPGVRTSLVRHNEDVPRSPSGYHLYNIHEMVSSMGKSKKVAMVLGINIAKGVIMIEPEKSRNGSPIEWTAEKLKHYSIEGKHVFIDLVQPGKSVDFHAGSKDTAQEIVAHLGELAGAVRAEGLREVWAASAGTGTGTKKKGLMLYEFAAQGDDEVTVAADDEVIVLDDKKSDEWWMVRRVKNGKEGVVPASYVEITGLLSGTEAIPGLHAAKSTVEQNRMEEARLVREATKNKSKETSIPQRGSSLADEPKESRQKTKPNQARVRTWTDRTGTFKVEAEFLALRDRKIHLHKQNGVRIAVPVDKMALDDIEYVERVTGTTLDDEKPIGIIQRRLTEKKKKEEESHRAQPKVGASVQNKHEEYWFDFFLTCGVNPQICQRYATSFSNDQMTPDVLPEVNEQLLRTLGLKEGDILRVMKHLDNKFDRKKSAAGPEGEGGLFSGPGGALKNNTTKGRPAPAVRAADTVSDDAFKPRELEKAAAGGFDDSAWDVKPAKSEPPKPEPSRPNVDLLSSILTPLEPEKPAPVTTAPPATTSAPAPQGADQALFDKIAALAPANRPKPQPQQATPTGLAPMTTTASAPGVPPPMGGQFGPQLQPQLTGHPAMYSQPQQFTGYNSTQAMPQNYPPLQPQPTGLSFQPASSFGQQQAMQQYPQPTGFQQPSYQQQLINGAQANSPFADPNPRQSFHPMPTGMAGMNPTGFQQQPSFNISQPTGLAPQPSMPQLPPQQTGGVFGPGQPVQPLMPQKTGPAPPVRFGVSSTPLAPQPTGRANLAKATPQNPFGF
ncbi:hypothetical protein K470DRAFT_282561 [Piedraia hortae CBS 480.64]|uniref:Actin cytoskeleton-regulatory complex protein SLA1 n=1 Tax=Piedraia hortae CBS 480.64 TaxID=1314780 RepID=A0A6A7BYT0_9PEZI|nr:hypothetical protein K470DRAFT_282561 [Piedraia hortae CBS 480.64]